LIIFLQSLEGFGHLLEERINLPDIKSPESGLELLLLDVKGSNFHGSSPAFPLIL